MKFRLRRGKPVHRVVHKLFGFYLERCQSLLAGSDPQVRCVHEVRKSIKRLRALVSLVRQGLGSKRGWFDRHLRDVNRKLSSVRDAEALREAFERLITATEPPPDEFAVVRAALWSWCDQHERPRHDTVRRACRELSQIERRWKKVKLPGRGWLLLEKNIRRAYRRGRRFIRRLSAQPTAAELHELRKRVKQTQYHWEFLQPLWPARLRAELAELEALSDHLGAHHDAQLLREWLISRVPSGMVPQCSPLVLQQLDHQQRQLEATIQHLAPLIFAETPRCISQRLQQYWRLWRRHSENLVRDEHHSSPTPPVSSVLP